MHTITTVSGKRIDLLNPDLSMIDIEDIAHHLALINRYSGATPLPYSVAQHSVYVAQSSKNLGGLLHDAHEAYIGDVTTPVKDAMEYLVASGSDAYADLDFLWTEAIERKFRLSDDPSILKDIHAADLGIRQDEMRCLKGVPAPVFFIKRIQPWGWRKAERKFLEMYAKLRT